MTHIRTLLTTADPASTPASRSLTEAELALLEEIVATPRGDLSGGTDADAGAAATQVPHRTGLLIALGAALTTAAAAVVFAVVVIIQQFPGAPPLSGDTPGNGVVADWPWYTTQQERLNRTDAIVRGRVVGEHRERIDEFDFRVVTYRVEAVAHGPIAPGASVDVLWLAGLELPIGMDTGDDVVLYLSAYGDWQPQRYQLLNPGQSTYLLSGTDLLTAESNTLPVPAEVRKKLGLAP